MPPRAGVLLLCLGSSAAFTTPALRATLRPKCALAAQNDDERMYEYYKKKWSKAAADDWLAGRQRDHGA